MSSSCTSSRKGHFNGKTFPIGKQLHLFFFFSGVWGVTLLGYSNIFFDFFVFFLPTFLRALEGFLSEICKTDIFNYFPQDSLFFPKFSLGPLFDLFASIIFLHDKKTPSTRVEDLQSLLRTVSTVSDAPEPAKPKRRRLKQCEQGKKTRGGDGRKGSEHNG